MATQRTTAKERTRTAERCMVRSGAGTSSSLPQALTLEGPSSPPGIRHELKGANARNPETDHRERDHVQRSGDHQDRRVAETMVEHPARQLAEDDPAHRAAKPHQARDRANRAPRNQVSWQNHHERGPRLLA